MEAQDTMHTGSACAECRCDVEWCAFCDEEDCDVALCYGCTVEVMGQSRPARHARGG
jgi:hypothetical protein